MKKRLFGIFLALTLAFTCFAVAACGDDGNKETPIGDPVPVELNYAEDTGVLSWDAVEGATKYKIRISNLNDAAKNEETSETTLQLYLRRGMSRISIVAEDEQGRDRGNGSKTVTLETDFGAPAAVTGVAFDKTAGTLGWNASEGAVKYLVSATSVNDESFVAVTDLEVTGTSAALALGKGIYDISVTAVNEHGAESLAANYRYASYVDSTYGTEIADGVYKLFDFEDDDVIDLSRFASDYKAWSQEAIKPAWSIVNKHEKLEDYTEADTVDFESKALKVRADYNADGDTLTRTGAVTFTLPEPLENWGRLYYDMFRTINPPAGVLLTDVTGRRVLMLVEYSHGATLGQWGTVSFTKSEVLASEPEFGALAEISFVLVNGKGGVAYFDNVRFDTVDLGYFGESLYRRSTDTFTFDAVAGAQKYEMFVDGAETPIELTEPEYRFETPLTTGNHSIKVIAYNGECSREQTYEFAVGEKIKFNVEKDSTGEFILADFDTVEYREYIATTSRDWDNKYARYNIADGKLNITNTDDWSGSYLVYTFPTEIQGAYIIKFNGVITSHPYFIDIIYKNSWTYTNDKGEEVTTNVDSIYSSSALTSATDLTYSVQQNKHDNPIVGIRVNACNATEPNRIEKTITLDSITYEKYVAVTGFNTKVADTENDYLLADFNVNGYNDYLTKAGNKVEYDTTKYSVKDGKLVIDPLTESGFNQTVKYTFPQPISKANMLSIKVKFSTTNSIKIYAFDELGNKTGTDSDGDWLGGTPNMDVSTYEGFSKLAGDKIVAIAFTLHNWENQAVVNIDEITYEYIDPVTNFNSFVEGTENEYLLTDFSASGYKKYLSSTGSPFSVSNGVLTYTTLDYAEKHYVKYTFPTPLTIAEVEEIKVTYNSTADTRILFFGETETEKTYGWFSQKTGDITKSSTAYSTFESGKIYGIGFSSSVKDTVINIKKITYTKKTA